MAKQRGLWRLGRKRKDDEGAAEVVEVERSVGDLQLAAGPSSRGRDWCELWVDECLEDEIGEEAFAELPERLAAALGLPVSDVLWEDREVVHVRAAGRSTDAVLDALERAAGLS
jgi:hypothetical protein